MLVLKIYPLISRLQKTKFLVQFLNYSNLLIHLLAFSFEVLRTDLSHRNMVKGSTSSNKLKDTLAILPRLMKTADVNIRTWRQQSLK